VTIDDLGRIIPVYSLTVSLLFCEEVARPILQISQAHGEDQSSTLRYAMSPGVAVPESLIEDLGGTFLQALVNAVRFTFGIQEELELTLPTGSSQENGR